MLSVGKQKEQEFSRFFRNVSEATTEQDIKDLLAYLATL